MTELNSKVKTVFKCNLFYPLIEASNKDLSSSSNNRGIRLKITTRVRDNLLEEGGDNYLCGNPKPSLLALALEYFCNSLSS